MIHYANYYRATASFIIITCYQLGVRMSADFWKLPSKRFYPDYYKMIKNPISLLQIRTKIKVRILLYDNYKAIMLKTNALSNTMILQRGEYGTVSEVAGDMNIMFENAKKYNVHTSRLYKVIIL